MVNLRFRAPLGDLEATYAVRLRLIGKLVVVFLIVIIELFFARCKDLGATSEYRLEIAVFKRGEGSFLPKISRTSGRPRPTILCVEKLNELSFHTV